MARGKSKIRLKTNSKGIKRWKKGHSSDSNPQTKSHRDAAKNRFFNINSGPSQLTTEALAKHDQDSASVMGDMEAMSDTRSDGGVSARTFNTWASNWTDCTNATFSKVHRYWGSSSELHREILAVLAAVTEVIKQQGGTESETTYFAALMTTLENVEGDTSATAVLYLLELAMKRVPTPVLKSRFSEVSKTLMAVLEAHADSSNVALIKSLLMCLARLLRVQDASVWNYSSTMQVYNTLLAFTTSAKPKARKAANNAVRIVLKGSLFMTSPNAPTHHPAAAATAKYCIQQIESTGGTAESTNTLHILGLLQNILPIFPLKSLKTTCETILKVMTLSNVIVTSTALKTLHTLFLAQPKESSLSAQLNAQLITALHDYQPSENDLQHMSAWLAVMEAAHINLFRLNQELCLNHVAKLFTVCMQCLQNNNTQLHQAATKTAKNLLKECLQPSKEYMKRCLKSSGPNNAVLKMFHEAEGGLSYQYHAAWQHVLHILTTFFEVAGKECSSIMKKCLLSLADLRDSHRFAYQRDLDTAFGMAVRTMGPRVVLDAVPLKITGINDDLDFPRSWLLPVMRENVRNTELGFFASYFLPLASKLRTIAVEHANKGENVQAKTYDALQLQMWSLLPGFCTNPTDFTQSFKDIARYLGMALSDREDLRSDVMSSLRKLLKQAADDESMKAELGRFAKNYLPILFNLYTASAEKEKDPSRQTVLETIRSYLAATDQQLVFSYFERCMSKLDEPDTAGAKQYAYLDLTTTMIPYLDTDRIKIMYTWVISKIQSMDQRLQKKCYVAMESLLGADSGACRTFVVQNLGELQEHLVSSLSTSSTVSKAPRLRCLLKMLKQLDEPHTEFVTTVIPEAVPCVKLTERPRKAAYDLLEELCHVMCRWAGPEAESEAVSDFVHMLLAGLESDPHMIACTVLAVTHIIFKFRDSVNQRLLNELINGVTTLLMSKSREIVLTTLALVKTLIGRCTDTTLAPHLSSLVDALVSMEKDQKHHFRFKTKDIFQKLVRKFGYEIIQNMLPPEHQKQLRNIKKTTERAKRKRTTSGSDESEDEGISMATTKVESIDELLRDSDSEDEKDRKKSRKQPSKKAGQAWLKEGGEGEIVDFLDSSVSKKVFASKPGPQSNKPTKVQHSFKTSTDGKLIITESGDEEDENEARKRKRKSAIKRKLEAEDDDDLEDLLGALSGQNLKNKKKKMAPESDVGDIADMTSEEVQASYKPGGHGIHRPVAQSGIDAEKQPKKMVRPGAEYKAKKAQGDVKRKDKPDPYAYIPLEMKLLNRRKRAKAAGQFKNMVSGAKKGARKGAKHRIKGKK